MLLWFTPLLFYMPKAIMASIIFAALKNMIKLQSGLKLWRVSKEDFGLFEIAFTSTALLGVTYGIGISIVSAVVLLVKNSSRPTTSTLGRLGDTDIYRDVKSFPKAKEIEGE